MAEWPLHKIESMFLKKKEGVKADNHKLLSNRKVRDNKVQSTLKQVQQCE